MLLGPASVLRRPGPRVLLQPKLGRKERPNCSPWKGRSELRTPWAALSFPEPPASRPCALRSSAGTLARPADLAPRHAMPPSDSASCRLSGPKGCNRKPAALARSAHLMVHLFPEFMNHH